MNNEQLPTGGRRRGTMASPNAECRMQNYPRGCKEKAARAVTGGQALRSTFSSKTMTEYQSPAVTLLPPMRCGVPDNIGVIGEPDDLWKHSNTTH